MAKAIKGVKKHFNKFGKEILKQMLALATSGFALVAALAWNEVIKELVAKYIEPAAGGASGVVSLLIYAIIVTIIAVLITYNLTLLIKKSK